MKLVVEPLLISLSLHLILGTNNNSKSVCIVYQWDLLNLDITIYVLIVPCILFKLKYISIIIYILWKFSMDKEYIASWRMDL